MRYRLPNLTGESVPQAKEFLDLLQTREHITLASIITTINVTIINVLSD